MLVARVPITDAELDQLVAFLQTRASPDLLATGAGLTGWLRGRGLISESEEVDEAGRRRTVHLRAALLGLLNEHAGTPPDPRTRMTLEAVTKAAPMGLVADTGGGLRLAPGGKGLDHALGMIAVAAYVTSERGNFERLKLCQGCQWAFFDSTKNRSRIWCEMATCGSQHKARAYRQRQASARST